MPKFEIKFRAKYKKTTLTGEAESLAQFARDNRADLRDADLRGAYLRGADLYSADLRGADLTGADLRGADLTGAYLTGADLAGAKIEWTSHTLVAEILWRVAPSPIEEQFAAWIGRKYEFCWEQFLAFDSPCKEWALAELRKWVTDGDNAPDALRNAPLPALGGDDE